MTMRLSAAAAPRLSLSRLLFLAAALLPSLVGAALAGQIDNDYDDLLNVDRYDNDNPLAFDLLPRYFLDAPALDRRDGGSSCATGYHSCNDINSTLCCANDLYCLIDPKSLNPACCAIGSICGSPCNATQYECNVTTTVTQTRTATTSVVTTTLLACCGRRCPGTSQYACPSSYGGGCCSYGQNCAPSGQCIWTASDTASSNAAKTATGIVSAIPSGCTTSQIACPTSLGGGCCQVGHTCTVVSNSVYCAPSTVSPTDSGITVVTGSPSDSGGGGGLSSGAKAGIAVGVIVGVAALVGAAVWVCLHERRRQREEAQEAERAAAEQQQPPLLPVSPVSGAPLAPLAGAGVPMTPRGPHDIVAPVEIGSSAASGPAGAAAVGRARGDSSGLLDPNDEKGEGERRAYAEVRREQPLLSGGLPASIQPTPPVVGPSAAANEPHYFELYGSEPASTMPAAAGLPQPTPPAEAPADVPMPPTSPISPATQGHSAGAGPPSPQMTKSPIVYDRPSLPPR